MTVNELLGISPLENASVEFKARLNREDTEDWLKTVAGFSNVSGGTLYVGVEDRSGKLLGFTETEAEGERNYFNNTVNQHIFSNPSVQISFIPYAVGGKQLLILCIRIGESKAKPVVLKYHNAPSIYMRRDGYTNGATYGEVINMCRNSDRTQYDAVVSSVSYDRSDFLLSHRLSQ